MYAYPYSYYYRSRYRYDFSVLTEKLQQLQNIKFSKIVVIDDMTFKISCAKNLLNWAIFTGGGLFAIKHVLALATNNSEGWLKWVGKIFSPLREQIPLTDMQIVGILALFSVAMTALKARGFINEVVVLQRLSKTSLKAVESQIRDLKKDPDFILIDPHSNIGEIQISSGSVGLSKMTLEIKNFRDNSWYELDYKSKKLRETI